MSTDFKPAYLTCRIDATLLLSSCVDTLVFDQGGSCMVILSNDSKIIEGSCGKRDNHCTGITSLTANQLRMRSSVIG